MSKTAETAEKLAAPIVAANDCSLWDVEYVREGGRMVLRVYIDHEGGVSTEHCEAVSRALESELDKYDPIAEGYVLEISSPGLERQLKKPRHFTESLGLEIELSFYKPIDGVKSLVGVLESFDGDAATVAGKTVNLKEISNAKRYFRFNI
jgi:ribosome maturation factor RimP